MKREKRSKRQLTCFLLINFLILSGYTEETQQVVSIGILTLPFVKFNSDSILKKSEKHFIFPAKYLKSFKKSDQVEAKKIIIQQIKRNLSSFGYFPTSYAKWLKSSVGKAYQGTNFIFSLCSYT